MRDCGSDFRCNSRDNAVVIGSPKRMALSVAPTGLRVAGSSLKAMGVGRDECPPL